VANIEELGLVGLAFLALANKWRLTFLAWGRYNYCIYAWLWGFSSSPLPIE
jgi:hypothetical protein